MYATRLVVAGDADEAWGHLIELARDWAWRRSAPPEDAESETGMEENNGRLTRWSTTRVPNDVRRLWRLETTDPPGTGGVRYRADVAIARTAVETSAFVSVGRLAAEGQIAPAPVGEFRRPTVVRGILAEATCYAGSQRLLSEPLKIRAAGINTLIEMLTDPARVLPVVVVSVNDSSGTQRAKQVADEACGLAHVIELSGWLALDGLQARLPEARLPLRGARIFWPHFGTPGDRWQHRWWTEAAIEEHRLDFPTYLFQMLSRLSVVALSRNRDADVIREAARLAEREERDRKLADARAANDLQSTVQELTSALDEEREYVTLLLEENAKLEDEVAILRPYKENFEAVTEWRESSEVHETPVVAADLPDSDDRNFSALWSALEEQSDGAIVFTSRARAEWAACDYPYPKKMRDAITKLARAAAEWRELDGRLGKSLTSWLGDGEGLTYAPDDEAMRRLKIHEFEFDGLILSRVSHIKLDDHVSPDRVGRIYFGIDQDGLRWVVDHVGLKLHNVARG